MGRLRGRVTTRIEQTRQGDHSVSRVDVSSQNGPGHDHGRRVQASPGRESSGMCRNHLSAILLSPVQRLAQEPPIVEFLKALQATIGKKLLIIRDGL